MLENANFTEWQAHINAEANSFLQNPLLLENGHLSIESPAIDRGANYLAPKTDIDGNLRPSGNSIDIGQMNIFLKKIIIIFKQQTFAIEDKNFKSNLLKLPLIFLPQSGANFLHLHPL